MINKRLCPAWGQQGRGHFSAFWRNQHLKMADSKIQPLWLDRAKKEAILTILFPSTAIRPESNEINTEENEQVDEQVQTHACDKPRYKTVSNARGSYVVWISYSPNPKPQLSQILPKLLTSIVGGCPCHCSGQCLMQIRIEAFYWDWATVSNPTLRSVYWFWDKWLWGILSSVSLLSFCDFVIWSRDGRKV